MPQTGRWDLNLAAASLVRAWMANDQDTGNLIIGQHGDEPAGLMLALAEVASRAVLTGNGFNPEKALKILDQWIETYAKADAAQRTKPGAP